MSLLLLFSPTTAPGYTLAVTNVNNTTVTHIGNGVYRITKTGGLDGNADANVTSAAMTGDFVLRVRFLNTTSWIDFGVSAVPAAGPYYVNIDRSLHVNVGDAVYGYEDGVYAGASVPLATTTFYFMRRVGSTITVLSGTSSDISAASVFDTLTDLGGTVSLDIGLVSASGTADVQLSLSEALAGSSSLSFSASGSLTGPGALTGTSALTFSPSATATGLGALSGTSTLTFSPASTLTGKGALSGDATITFNPSATLTGKGALSGSSSLTFSPSGAITGTGALSGSSALVFAASGTSTGTGALSGTSALSFTPSGTITGSGALTGTSPLSFAPSGTLTGLAPLTGTASVTFAATGTLGGIVYITGVTTLALAVAGTLTGIDLVQTAKRTRRLRNSNRDYPDTWGVWR